jgi:hypothetical protein
MMNNVFFFPRNQNKTLFFIDKIRSRVRVRVRSKHKREDRFIVRTIKILALIPNLMRKNEQKELKHKRNKLLEKEAKN